MALSPGPRTSLILLRSRLQAVLNATCGSALSGSDALCNAARRHGFESFSHTRTVLSPPLALPLCALPRSLPPSLSPCSPRIPRAFPLPPSSRCSSRMRRLAHAASSPTTLFHNSYLIAHARAAARREAQAWGT
eukprot:2682001-Rhodomonas_salina.3